MYHLELLKQVDLINIEISELENEKLNIYKKLKNYKIQIAKDHQYLIGKKAMCSHINRKYDVECVCTAVIALDDFSGVKPLFSHNGKKFIAETYDWIN